ncbi:hypothetical protein NDU88_007368 [Pleurodeles waltl]|uniref:Uncharacterized protein n=1 Tax=Pleurodeles waltl TaxID=8319 RepID=A0AAV7N6S2_PLEWA|nr:hypothetical protein NDU88_007368 [Pleurodeles waltl]
MHCMPTHIKKLLGRGYSRQQDGALVEDSAGRTKHLSFIRKQSGCPAPVPILCGIPEATSAKASLLLIKWCWGAEFGGMHEASEDLYAACLTALWEDEDLCGWKLQVQRGCLCCRKSLAPSACTWGGQTFILVRLRL